MRVDFQDKSIAYGQDFDGNGFNDLKVTLSLNAGSNSGTDDILGVAFDINGDAVSGLQIVGIHPSEQSPTARLDRLAFSLSNSDLS